MHRKSGLLHYETATVNGKKFAKRGILTELLWASDLFSTNSDDMANQSQWLNESIDSAPHKNSTDQESDKDF